MEGIHSAICRCACNYTHFRLRKLLEDLKLKVIFGLMSLKGSRSPFSDLNLDPKGIRYPKLDAAFEHTCIFFAGKTVSLNLVCIHVYEFNPLTADIQI